MNHVAHCLLSFPNEGLLIGNFIGDYVKGSTWKNFPRPVQLGIQLHRFIDAHTEHAPAMKSSIQRLRPFAGRFAAPVADIVYDHLLCSLWEQVLDKVEFEHFAQWAYAGLHAQQVWMPERLQQRWPDMMAGQFLHLYQSMEGLAWTLERFAQRLPLPFHWSELLEFLAENRAVLEEDFYQFFPHLSRQVAHWRQERGVA